MKNKTKYIDVYHFLKSKILSMQLMPGESININNLVTYLGISRSPVRDALLKLEKEELVTSSPKVGTRVSKINISRSLEERFIRACIETKVIEEFIQVYTAADMERLVSLQAQLKVAIEQRQLREAFALDNSFHQVFFDTTQHMLSFQTLQEQSNHYTRFRLLGLTELSLMDKVCSDHDALIALIQAKNTIEAQRTLESHITPDNTKRILRQRYSDLFDHVDAQQATAENIFERDFLLDL